ncbi:hypothetical protein T484DRAFT_1939990 [Baffinella frigidus]|nr:hypothetical protein T484DRAFT_1939990 [Cryptophyta sp. CCMP2293]|mmetsp:Transcript_54125/g.128576  ORF Transcript_54125/g.128576 Transcript_54125/m.128576 type:complete len:398 (+) Transcript_54125:50-1243(+)
MPTRPTQLSPDTISQNSLLASREPQHARRTPRGQHCTAHWRSHSVSADTMADTNWLDASSTMFNDPASADPFAAEVDLATTPAQDWLTTTGLDDSAVLLRAASCSAAAHEYSFGDSAGLSRAASCSTADLKSSSTLDGSSTVSAGNTPDSFRAALGTGTPAKGAARSRAVFVDRSILDSMMHLPRDKAAESLGLCATTFKKVCRRAGLQGWPYRRPLLGAIQESAASMPLSRDSSFTSQEVGAAMSFSWGGSRQHSPNQQSSPLMARTPSAPERWISGPAADDTFQRTLSQPTAVRSYMAFSSAFSTTASNGATSCLDALRSSSAASQRSAPEGIPFTSLQVSSALSASALAAAEGAERSCHVVDAVMDYLDNLSSGNGAFYYGELEAVIDSFDEEG